MYCLFRPKNSRAAKTPFYGTIRITRFTAREFQAGDALSGMLNTGTHIWEDTDPSHYGSHLGGGLTISSDKHMYFGIGDKYEFAVLGDIRIAENMSRAGGKIHRIHLNGSAVTGNMGASDPTALGTIFAIGYRNPYSGSWDDEKRRYIVADVGDGSRSGKYGWEDVHVVKPGSHGGWPHCEGPCSRPDSTRSNQWPGCNCSKHDNPVLTYPHVRGMWTSNNQMLYGAHASKNKNRAHYLWGEGGEWALEQRDDDTGERMLRPKLGGSVISGSIYQGSMFPKEYRGRYIFGDYVRNTLYSIRLPEGSNVASSSKLPVNLDMHRLTHTAGSDGVNLGPTAITEAPDGSLLVALRDGTINRVTYAPVPNLCEYLSSDPAQWWKRRCDGVSVTAGVVDSRGGPQIDGNAEVEVPGNPHPGVFAVGAASMYLLGDADLAPGQAFGWALHSARRAAKEIVRQLGAQGSPLTLQTHEACAESTGGGFPSHCTKLVTHGGAHRSGPIIKVFADVMNATSCAIKCSADSRCVYWTIHNTNGCQLRPDKRKFVESLSFRNGHGDCTTDAVADNVNGLRCNAEHSGTNSTPPSTHTVAPVHYAAGEPSKCAESDTLPLCTCIALAPTEPVIHHGSREWEWLDTSYIRGDWCAVGTEPCRLISLDKLTGRRLPSVRPGREHVGDGKSSTATHYWTEVANVEGFACDEANANCKLLPLCTCTSVWPQTVNDSVLCRSSAADDEAPICSDWCAVGDKPCRLVLPDKFTGRRHPTMHTAKTSFWAEIANVDGFACNANKTKCKPVQCKTDDNEARSLVWEACSGEPLAMCADLAFCQSADKLTSAYRLLNETDRECTRLLAPLIRMAAGTQYRLTLHNDATTPANIHTHGLHISGAGNADDATRHAEPGECLVYHWDVPADHPSGTYWYHGHVHGHALEQVSGGAFGMLIIDDAGGSVSIAPVDQPAIAAWLGSQNELLLVAFKNIATGVWSGTRPGVPVSTVVASSLAEKVGTPISTRLQGVTFRVIANEWYRLRILAVDADGAPSKLIIGPKCESHLVAADGVWRTKMPGPLQRGYNLTGASRVDLAIRCSATDTVAYDTGVVATMSATCHYSNAVAANNTADNSTVTRASPWSTSTTDRLWSPSSSRPNYLRDLRAVSPDAKYTMVVHAMVWDAATPNHTIAYDSVQEWTIEASAFHPFHLHVFHMQIVTAGGCEGGYEEGEYYDTIASPQAGGCMVRFHVVDYGEKVMMHCHVLKHEDAGQMVWFDIASTPAGLVQSSAGRASTACAATSSPQSTP